MVGVGVADGGGGGGVGGGGSEPYYGEYYPHAEQYYVPPEMCSHPQQHPQHPHMCAVHTEYGGMPVVTSPTMMPQMMPPPVMDDNLRHYLVHAHPQHAHHGVPHQPVPHQPHQPQHHQPPPPHHQPPHHYGPANGAGGPQHFYGAGYPQHYHMPPHHMPHYPPPPVYQKDERAQRQYSKLKQKLERKQHNNRNNGIEVNSGASTPSLSPRKDLNGTRSGSSGGGGWSEGESSSAGASLQGDDDNSTQVLLDLLSATRTPQVSEMTPTSALVQWNSPLPEHVTLPRVELTYELLLGDRGRYKAIYSGPKLSCRVCDLKPGYEYSVCLQIRAGDVTGAASEAATFRAPPAPPARPAAPRVAQRTRTSLQLRWTAAQDNGSRVAHYVLELDTGAGYAEVARPRSRQHTVGELPPQTRCRLRLAAVNECGRGEWSDEVVAWTAGAPPPAPRPPRLLDAARDSLALAWERRTPDEEFSLQMDAQAGLGYLYVYNGTDEHYTCIALRRATDYRFRLRCETADGQGPWSPEVAYRTLAERPAPPPRPTLRGKVHSRAFRLRWEAPPDDGGAPIDSYTLELDDGEGFREAYSGAEREAACERLAPGTQYRARVCATNAAGTGEWSASETVTTEPAPPAPCATPELAAAPRATLAALRWRPPDSTGGAPLTEYRLEVFDAEGKSRLAYCGLETEFTVRDLTPGAAYSVTVTPVTRAGAATPSPPLVVRAAPAPPDAPALPTLASPQARTATISWTAPVDNGSPILDYRLEMSANNVDDAFSEVYRGTATEHVVEKLTPFSPYFFRVCASNAAGRGAWSPVRDYLTERAPPAAPAPPRHEPEAGALRLAWRAPADHGAPILRYRLRVDELELDTDGAVTEYLVEGLAPDTTYRVRLAAVNELGCSEWSDAVRAATRPPPPSPPRLECVQRAHNHLKLKWGEGAADTAQYRLEMRAPDSRDFRPAYRGSARSCKVKKLREATTYAFRIRASDERGGRGEWSEPVEASTTAAPPPAPRAPLLEPCGRGAVVRWDPLEGVDYAVHLARVAGGAVSPYRQVWGGPAPRCALDDLEPGEYLVRVVASRAGLVGAPSPPARLALSAPVPPAVGSAVASAGVRAKRARGGRGLLARHTALLMAGGFLLVAVLVAVVVQRLVEPRP